MSSVEHICMYICSSIYTKYVLQSTYKVLYKVLHTIKYVVVSIIEPYFCVLPFRLIGKLLKMQRTCSCLDELFASDRF